MKLLTALLLASITITANAASDYPTHTTVSKEDMAVWKANYKKDVCGSQKKWLAEARQRAKEQIDKDIVTFGKPIYPSSVEEDGSVEAFSTSLNGCEKNRQIIEAARDGRCESVRKVARFDDRGNMEGYGCTYKVEPQPLRINIYVYKK